MEHEAAVCPLPRRLGEKRASTPHQAGQTPEIAVRPPNTIGPEASWDPAKDQLRPIRNGSDIARFWRKTQSDRLLARI